MIYRFAFSYIAFLYVIIICLIYFAKQEFFDTRNRIYKALVINTVVACSLEAVFSIFLALDINFMLPIIFKLYWFTIYIWTIISYLYKRTIIDNVTNKRIIDVLKDNKIFVIVFSVLEFACIILANPALSNDDILFSLDSIYMVLSISLIICIHLIGVYSAFRRWKTVFGPFRKIIIINPTILLIALILQIVFHNESIISMGYVIAIYTLFLIYENPDVEILNRLNATNRLLDKTMDAKSNFLSNINDGILTPVDSLNEIVNSIHNSNDINEIHSNMSSLLNTSNNILDSINNILINSNINASMDTIQSKEYSLYDIINNNINKVNRKIDRNEVKFAVNMSPNLSTILMGDADRLNQIIYNLLSNAAKFTTVGRIYFNIASTKQDNIEYLTFEISDTGCGIKDKDMVFNYIDPDTNRGFNLYSTKRNVEILGGKIWFDSIYLAGTTFYVQIPQQIVDPTPIGVTANNKEDNNTIIDCSNYRALIVESDELNAKLFAKMLSKYNFNIEHVNSGNDCIFNIKNEKQYDIIFLNYILPDLNGLSVLNTLKHLDGYKLPPIVSISANAVVGNKEMHLRAGFDDYLLKPVSQKDLNKVINKFFNK